MNNAASFLLSNKVSINALMLQKSVKRTNFGMGRSVFNVWLQEDTITTGDNASVNNP